MKNTVFKGMATALVTPMTKDGIDYDALGRFIDFQIDSGINALVVMGTTGENATIEYDDQKEVIRYTVERVNHRVPAPTTPPMFWKTPATPAKWARTRFWW